MKIPAMGLIGSAKTHTRHEWHGLKPDFKGIISDKIGRKGFTKAQLAKLQAEKNARFHFQVTTAFPLQKALRSATAFSSGLDPSQTPGVP